MQFGGAAVSNYSEAETYIVRLLQGYNAISLADDSHADKFLKHLKQCRAAAFVTVVVVSLMVEWRLRKGRSSKLALLIPGSTRSVSGRRGSARIARVSYPQNATWSLRKVKVRQSFPIMDRTRYFRRGRRALRSDVLRLMRFGFINNCNCITVSFAIAPSRILNFEKNELRHFAVDETRRVD
ncbi:hypothetical protein EVAR_63412_1 [Eumeta japonica]|uniref:Uncharacterized protein n=1 Tax=Eumeta variegata TaxID=151549 RepID=A0A4C1Z3A7_EUMVA|nr:hypothetical protein EVAR_63412_1 [Eumeta japonica]